MNRRALLVLCLGLLVSASAGRAEIAVEILGVPRSLYSYEPVWVVYEARNDGGMPELVPVGEACRGEGVVVEVARRGGPRWDSQFTSSCGSQRMVWLPPGERWLFFEQIRLGGAATYDIEAVLRNRGECRGTFVGPERPPIEPVDITNGVRHFACWEGEARSQRITIEVALPTSEIDKEAAQFLGFDGKHPVDRIAFLGKFTELQERFPASHYTYAASGSTETALSMVYAVILQPDNPLNPWASGAMAAARAYRKRKCAPPRREAPGAPPDLEEWYEEVIAAYPPPQPVKDYLRQMEREYAGEECPERKAEEGERNE